ncbi:MAG: UDP-N-acetylmuramoyl-L-alanyl-D-glutamate--2,6-diaminopimelate ligase [Clostridia bacterium]|nr:UDP-N-acetylmuramoyl-L-alanyl-D-glutamate--2,6-diaminopimelate ligase [Clostridia bacterium]
MELNKILSGLEGLKVRGSLETKIKQVESDSRNIEKDSLFVAIRGFDTDGNDYIMSAIEKGAIAVMVQEGTDTKMLKQIPEDIVVIIAKDTRYALAICACNFYKNPSKKFKLIGITGTKGKTTTSYMIKEILEKSGKKVGLIGTIATYIGDRKVEENSRTTPESIKLQKLFSDMQKAECDVVVMEVSSQSLKLNRVTGSDFDIGIFTNFSEDHISPKEHPDMQDYFNSKLKLFDMCSKGVILNADDVYTVKAKRMINNEEIITYGIDNGCDFLAKDITITNSYVDFKVRLQDRNERVKTCIPGRFSIYNSLAAIAACTKIGCSVENIKEGLEEVRVPGRSELVDNDKELTIMIDYAHSPESLERIIKAVKTYTRGRVIVVFGCGGDRDTSKRAIMGEISGREADFTVITSDNPRTENPEKIVKQIEEGTKKTNGKYKCIVDRRNAIKYAISMANKLDIIVLAGKGHETYQEINGTNNDFDERKIIKEILNQK